METRRMFLALAVASGVFLAYTLVYRTFFAPPRPPPASGPAVRGAGAVDGAPPGAHGASTSEPGATSVASSQIGGRMSFTAAPDRDAFFIGDFPGATLRAEVSPVGAAVATLQLTSKDDSRYRYRESAEGDAPYPVLSPVATDTGIARSYETLMLVIPGLGAGEWPMSDVVWSTVERDERRATLSTTLTAEDGAELVRVTKSFEVSEQGPLLTMRVAVENLTEAPLRISVEQGGPIGIPRENTTYNMRFLATGLRSGASIKLDAKDRDKLARSAPLELLPADRISEFAWTALINKYFGVFSRVLEPGDGAAAARLQLIRGDTVAPTSSDAVHAGDLRARLATAEQTLGRGERMELGLEVYAGPKDHGVMQAVNAAFVDESRIGYIAAIDADTRCCCNVPVLNSLMTALLGLIETVVRNYGVAIMILVLIIKTLLHPLSVYQQKSMYRFQESMSKLQPKLAAVKEQYPNDKARQNQETMKVYAEQGVNPMAPMVGMIPMFIQMPILIALWTAVNTDIHLRHAPFDGWWIDDLSAPDELIKFAQPITIPVLGWLPLVGRMFQDVPSLNLLPILMGVSMWLQQKYMPKPHMQARLEEAKKSQHKDALGMTPEDQMRQQQMMIYMMSIMMPLMLYYFPSGLALYWMSSNVYGIVESLIIRRQIERDKQRRAADPKPAAPKKTGLMGKMMQRMATQAEELQRKADELSERGPARSDRAKREKQDKKKSR